MGDYPDPDEEYELMYADELEMLQEEDDHNCKYYILYIIVLFLYWKLHKFVTYSVCSFRW